MIKKNKYDSVLSCTSFLGESKVRTVFDKILKRKKKKKNLYINNRVRQVASLGFHFMSDAVPTHITRNIMYKKTFYYSFT